MRISTPTEYLAKNYGYEKALEMIAAQVLTVRSLSTIPTHGKPSAETK